MVYEDRGPTVFVVTLVMLVLATLFLAMRLVIPLGIVKRYSSDDWLTSLAWVGGLTFPMPLAETFQHLLSDVG